MARLTKQTCDRFTFTGDNPKAFCVLWDGELKGFGLRVYPTGRKSFIVKYRHAGRQGIHKIGPYGPLTVEMARKMATAFLGGLAQGIDPATRRAQDATFADLANRYMEDYSKVHKKSWQHDQRRLDSAYSRPSADGQLPASPGRKSSGTIRRSERKLASMRRIGNWRCSPRCLSMPGKSN